MVSYFRRTKFPKSYPQKELGLSCILADPSLIPSLSCNTYHCIYAHCYGPYCEPESFSNPAAPAFDEPERGQAVTRIGAFVEGCAVIKVRAKLPERGEVRL